MKPRRIFRQIPPPWHITSKKIYLRKKSQNKYNVDRSPVADFENAISLLKIANQDILTRRDSLIEIKNLDNEALAKNVNIALTKLSVSLQCLPYLSTFRPRQYLVNLLNYLPSIIPYTSPNELVKLIISIDQSHIYTPRHDTYTILFKHLSDNISEVVNSSNIVLLIQSYLNISARHGENALESALYNNLINLLTTDLQSSETDLSKLMILYEKHAIFDEKLFNHIVNRIGDEFTLFDQDQIGSLSRWLVKCLGYDINDAYSSENPIFWDKKHISSIDLKSSKDVIGRCRSKLFKVLKLKALGKRPVKYIDKGIPFALPNSNIKLKRLGDFDLSKSKLIKIFSDNLPYYLHEYRYYNLVDVAEMYYMFDIKDSDIIKRFGLEIWKHVARMKYGYKIKALIVLAFLGIDDKTVYNWLMRGIPHTLTFTWEPEMICDCIIALEKIKCKKLKLYDRLSMYLQKNFPSIKKSHLLVNVSRALANANSAQPSLLNQIARLVDMEPRWMNLQQLISIASDCITLKIKISLLFEFILNGERLKEVEQTSLEHLALIPQIYLYYYYPHDFYVSNFNAVLDSKVFENEMVKKTLERFLEEDFTINFVNLMRFLQSLINMSIILENSGKLVEKILIDNIDSLEAKHLPMLFSILGNGTNSVEINQKYNKTLEKLIVDTNGEMNAEEAIVCLWYSHFLGFAADSNVVTLLSQIIIRNQKIKNEYYIHLIKVIAAWIRCEVEDSNVNELSQPILQFLRKSDKLTDMSDNILIDKIKKVHTLVGPEYKTLLKEEPFTIHIGKISGGVSNAIFVEDDLYTREAHISNGGLEFKAAHLKPYYRMRAWYLQRKGWNLLYWDEQSKYENCQ